jgi:hypothetical protein
VQPSTHIFRLGNLKIYRILLSLGLTLAQLKATQEHVMFLFFSTLQCVLILLENSSFIKLFLKSQSL